MEKADKIDRIYETFRSLKFEPHHMAEHLKKDFKMCTHNFDNGFGISILLGDLFYSNGVNTYEVAILRDGQLTYTSGITSDVLGHQTRKEITNIMRDIQELEKGYVEPEIEEISVFEKGRELKVSIPIDV